MRFGLIALTILTLNLPAIAATPEEVEASIRKGVEFLYSRQNNGNWETRATREIGGRNHDTAGGQWGGLTSIATYALLAAGEKPLDPRIVQATDFLRNAEIVGNYALGMRAQVWLYLPRTEQNQQAMLRDAQLLIRGLSVGGNNRGFYDYIAGGSRIDLSVSQYGVLGMWAAADFLQEVPENYWREVENAWLRQQDRRLGGWAYAGRPSDSHPYQPSIAAAGVATLFITQEFLYANQGIDCKGNISNPGMQAIDKGLAYMAKALPGLLDGNSPPEYMNAGHPKNRLYTLYGVERIGVASGYKYFDNIDWYQAGAEFLVRTQRNDGSWGNIPDTCFALLFLSRGRAPVMMNKLRYTDVPARAGANPVEAAWNQRPRDAANITRWVSKQSERTLNWQIIDLDVATALDLHDAPILYLTGSNRLNLSAEAKQKIKTYIDQGGLLLANADCGNRNFANSVRELANELYPLYEMRPLPQTHIIHTGQQFVGRPNARRAELQGVSNGARELILLIPTDDLGRAWQRRDMQRPELTEIAANIYLYAIDKTNSLYKGQTYLVSKKENVETTKTLRLARLQYTGNWNPEPGGWQRMAAILHNTADTTLDLRDINLATTDIPEDVHVAHLTGTTAFRLSDSERERLKKFVDAGGMLIVDSAGGNGEFNTSAEAELRALFGDAAAGINQPLPEGHAIYNTPSKIEIGYRTFARGKLVGSMSSPRLRGIELNGRLAVVYSPEDLTVGLVGQPVDGIIGYTPAAATELMKRLLVSRLP